MTRPSGVANGEHGRPLRDHTPTPILPERLLDRVVRSARERHDFQPCVSRRDLSHDVATHRKAETADSRGIDCGLRF